MKKQKFKWTVEFEVDEVWVIDGFELTQDIAKEMIEETLNWSYDYETKARIIKKPKHKDLLKAWGGKS